jgi:hypothetical protein
MDLVSGLTEILVLMQRKTGEMFRACCALMKIKCSIVFCSTVLNVSSDLRSEVCVECVAFSKAKTLRWCLCGYDIRSGGSFCPCSSTEINNISGMYV